MPEMRIFTLWYVRAICVRGTARATMEQREQDVRDAILLLLRACKLHQARALSLNTTLAAMISLPHNQRAELGASQIRDNVQNAEAQARQTIEQQSAELERALSCDADFLLPLRAYVSQQFGKS
jgi:hypothetical protein